MENWENVNFTIETQPFTTELKKDEVGIKSKYKWNWRINQLALPKSVITKFAPLPKFRVGKIDPECEWRTNQLANPPLMRLIVNKNQSPNAKLVEILNKHIDNTLNSIYYYYYKKRRELKAKKLAAKLKRKKQKTKTPTAAEIEKQKQEFFAQLSKPKPKIVPEPVPKIWRNLDELMSGILRLAQPRTYIELKPKILEVSPHALKYEITPNIERLAQVPEHRKYIRPPPTPPPRPLIKIKDMHIVLSERLQRISQPKPRSMKKDEDLKEDPWSIAPNALKYKATPRIIELAKPIDRD